MAEGPQSRRERDDARAELHIRNVRTIPSKDLTRLQILGSGGFGKVSKVEYQNGQEKLVLAYKYPKSQSGPINDYERRGFEQEAAKQSSLDHKNIMKLFAIVNEEEVFGLVMEYAENGDMREYIKKNNIGEKGTCLLILGVSEGIEYLHQQEPPIIHGDLKLENVLITRDGHAKITDFGLSFWREYSKSHSEEEVLSGTLTNIPPEYFAKANLRKVENFDVYGFAVLMWESVTKSKAFYGEEMPKFITEGKRPLTTIYSEGYPPALKDLTEKCWAQEPKERPLFPSIRQELFDMSNQL